MDTLSVLIPSRLGKVSAGTGSRLFVERAIESIRCQTIAHRLKFQILVGVDAGASKPAPLCGDPEIRLAMSTGRSQAAALNAAASLIDGSLVSILEDDDQWDPRFLEHATNSLQTVDFVSSTQLEIGTEGEIVRINDFPTPSGWVMRRATREAVGNFDESLRWHLDNDWLGRLGDKRLLRAHLVEATAPIQPHIVGPIRPWLVNYLRFGGPSCRLVRHDSPWPLVKRHVHGEAGTQRIIRDPMLLAESRNECQILMGRFGRVPW